MRSKDRIALQSRFWQIFSSANSIRTENQSPGRQSTRFFRPKLARIHRTETNTQHKERMTTMSRRPTICKVLSQSMSTRFTGITQKAGGNLSWFIGWWFVFKHDKRFANLNWIKASKRSKFKRNLSDITNLSLLIDIIIMRNAIYIPNNLSPLSNIAQHFTYMKYLKTQTGARVEVSSVALFLLTFANIWAYLARVPSTNRAGVCRLLRLMDVDGFFSSSLFSRACCRTKVRTLTALHINFEACN